MSWTKTILVRVCRKCDLLVICKVITKTTVALVNKLDAGDDRLTNQGIGVGLLFRIQNTGILSLINRLCKTVV